MIKFFVFLALCIAFTIIVARHVLPKLSEQVTQQCDADNTCHDRTT